MEDLLYSFNAGTRASKAPMPTDFRHLLGFVTKDERFLSIHTHEELINIDEQLNQTLNLQVSNIISRVIAQLIGLSDLGWRTIKATPEGALKVAIDGLLSDTKNLLYEPIDDALLGNNVIITGSSGYKTHVETIVFTVASEVDVQLFSGANPISGLMDFGAAGQPSGIVIPLGFGPIVCGTEENFIIDLSDTVQISGFVTYFKQLA